MRINRLSRARHLKKQLTLAEKKLWSELRCQQFETLRFRRQVPISVHIINFACFEPKLAIVVDGSPQREVLADDKKRIEDLELLGYTVLCFCNNEVLNEIDKVKAVIWNTCAALVGL